MDNKSMSTAFANVYLQEVISICSELDVSAIESTVAVLSASRKKNGRLFILGAGGSAGNASHAVNDFRKICGIEAYSPTDNVSELTARTNDEGWETVFEEWLKISKLSDNDVILILSVGGGDEKNCISVGLIKAIKLAKSVGAQILSIVGKRDGFAALNSDVSVIIPQIEKSRVTPHAEEFQAIVWHLLVSHPNLKISETKWESVSGNE